MTAGSITTQSIDPSLLVKNTDKVVIIPACLYSPPAEQYQGLLTLPNTFAFPVQLRVGEPLDDSGDSVELVLTRLRHLYTRSVKRGFPILVPHNLLTESGMMDCAPRTAELVADVFSKHFGVSLPRVPMDAGFEIDFG